MKKLLSTLMALALALVLASPATSLAAPDSPVPPFAYEEAASFEDANDGVVKLHKYLVMDENAAVPAATFSYTIAPSEQTADADGFIVAPSETSLPVYPGVAGAAAIEDVVFEGTESATDGLPTDGASASAGYKYASKDITVDFSDCEFLKPGVYRYILTEVKPAEADAFLYDTFAEHEDDAHGTEYKRTIDVYVESVDEVAGTPAQGASWTYDGVDYATEEEAQAKKAEDEAAGGKNEGQDLPITANPAVEAVEGTPAGLKVIGFVCYEGDIEDAEVTPDYEVEGTQGEYVIGDPEGEGAADKTDSYVNEYQTVDLQVTKTVTGNQGDKEDTFFFTVKIENLTAGAKVSAYMAKNSDTAIDPATASTYDQKVEWTADADGKIEQTVELGHKGRVLVKGIAVGASYEVNELAEEGGAAVANNGKTADGYTVTYATNGDTAPNKDAATAFGEVTDNLYTVDVTNTRTGVIPTGVAMGVGGTLVLLGAAVLYFVIRRRTAGLAD